MTVVAAQASDAIVAAQIRIGDLLRRWLPFALVLSTAVALRHFVVANTDVSWQITLAEKVLGGQRLYTDLIEVNPPGSTFIYLPAVALARTLGWRPEVVVDTLIFIAALVSLGIVSDAVRRYRLLDGLHGWTIAAFALAVLTILPAQTFGEREHVVLIAVLPALAILAARANGARPLLWHCLVAGAGIGVTVCIKPHFALAIGFAAAAAALHLRSWRVLAVLENWIGAAIVVAYGVCVVVFYRSYMTDVMPLVADVYLPVRLSLAKTLIDPPVALWTAGILVVLGLRREAGDHPVFPVLIMASVGFAAAYVIQGKGWPYQSYPMLALMLIALGLAAACRRRAATPGGAYDGFKSVCAMIGLGVIAGLSFVRFNLHVDTAAAAAAVKRVAPPHPSIVMISDDIAIGHPLVRAVEGRWISRFCSLWVIGNSAFIRFTGGLDEATAQRLSAYAQAQRQILIGEIRDGNPDIILVDGRNGYWSNWLNTDPDLSKLVASNYREVDSADEVAILKRNGT